MAIKNLSGLDLPVVSSVLKTDANGVIVSAVAGTDYLSSINSSMVTTALGYTPVPTTRTITINGTALDLSANRSWTISTITGNAGSATVLQTARTLTIGATGKTFNGSANVSWSLAEIGAAATSHTHNIWDLPFRRSGVNVDNVGSDNLFETTRTTGTGQGTWPGTYEYLVSFGDESAGIQFVKSFGTGTKLYFRGGTDNPNSENGANAYTNWRGLWDSSDFSSTNISNWNTAYGWGNHASAGYAPLASPALTGVPTAPTATAGTNTTQIATTAFVQTAVSNLIDSAPATLDTLNELAAALGDDPNFANTVATSIGGKVSKTGDTMTGDLTLSYAYPRINLYDTNNNSDYSIINNDGSFSIYDITNNSHRLQINSSGNLTLVGTITASGYNKSNWDTAYGWGNHAGLYLGISDTAVDSNKLGGLAASSYYLASNPSGYITSSSNITGTSAGVVRTVTGTTSAELVRGNMGDNDQARILVGATASNAGYLEIATADDGTEPIYVRQYTGVFSTLTRTATLLDGSGNTSFPGTVTAPTFSGALSGNATTATTLATARTLTIGNTGKTFNGSANVSWSLAEIGAYAATNPSGFTSNTGTVTSVAGTGGYGGLTLSGTVTTSGSITLGGTPTGTWPISVSGNAATATSATSATTATTAGTWTTARTLTIGSTGKSVNGSANVSWSIAEIGALALTGGTITGVIDSTGNASGYRFDGRSFSWNSSMQTPTTYVPHVMQDTYTGWDPVIGIKTTNGFWQHGAYSNDTLYWGYMAGAFGGHAANSFDYAVSLSPTVMNVGSSGTMTLQVNGNAVIHAGNIASQSVNYATSSGNADTVDSLHAASFIRSDADDAFTGNLTTGADNHITFGPNSTWGSSLRVGGNGRTATGTEMASVVTTDGNLHLDAAASNNAIYLNYYAGTSGVAFGNGASAIVARMDASGNLYKATSISNSTATYWHSANDGDSSGLDADLLDGNHASAFALASHTHSYLPLSGGALTGNTSLNTGISLLFSGLADTNWRIGRNIVTESSNNLTSNTLQFIAAASAGQGWQFVGSTGITRFEIDASNGATYLNGTQFDFTGSAIALRNNTDFQFLTRSNAAQQARFKGIQVSTSYSGTVPSNGILFFTDTKLSRTDVQELSTNSNFIPDADRTYNLGREDARWRTVYCETLDSAGLHESNLADKEISEQETGTVMSWQNGKMVPCSKFADHMRMGIAVKGNSSPLVQGAEPVLCTGDVTEGQYLVTSETIGHAVGVDRSYVVEHQLFDCVIGKALESGSGDSFIVKTWVNI